jgi:hypothetical protein
LIYGDNGVVDGALEVIFELLKPQPHAPFELLCCLQTSYFSCYVRG